MYWIKLENENGQYADNSGNRFDVIGSDNVTFPSNPPSYTECDYLKDALTALGLELYSDHPKRYSRLKIINKLGNNWIAIESGMDQLEKAKFYGATFLERGDSDFEAFIEKLKPTMPNIEDLLVGCEYV